ncbi:conserved hypothetical protein [Streptomyces himastatinicus ATCC 53653]|uniref:Uncharacterized protein n=1 Tax=Streptomyces himastatinicus ATCC 53653 TaxID=457427 RepID=D9WWY3_9ACTN|nr:hypothetical protein [Streptomyces himastatinicus]EFL29411.1 conserved hypothetical protein [Streptomyces himastatinicus ATCC 53653]
MAHANQAPANAEGPTSHTQIQAAGLAKLREPFPKAQINPLPKIICGQCSKSPTKECGNHRKGKCRECDNWITSAHMHLDYVGHAELTNRLLEADLLWDWEPLAVDDAGLPKFDGFGGLWIRLTVCGHTRLGYGDSQGKSGPNAVKEAIGDALRNAAMRFGAALDLWAKSDLREAQAEHPKTADEDGAPARGAQSEPQHARPAEQRPTVTPEQTQQSTLDQFKSKVADGWGDLHKMRQNLLEAKAEALVNEVVPPPPRTTRRRGSGNC